MTEQTVTPVAVTLPRGCVGALEPYFARKAKRAAAKHPTALQAARPKLP